MADTAPLTDAQRDEIVDRIYARTQSAGPDHLSPREAIEAAVKEAEGVLASSGWRDIATAPRDGSHFLAWGPLADGETWEYTVAMWDDDHQEWISPSDADVVHENPARYCLNGITHWQPLPSGPAPVKGEE
jgi:hypothetical protein